MPLSGRRRARCLKEASTGESSRSRSSSRTSARRGIRSRSNSKSWASSATRSSSALPDSTAPAGTARPRVTARPTSFTYARARSSASANTRMSTRRSRELSEDVRHDRLTRDRGQPLAGTRCDGGGPRRQQRVLRVGDVPLHQLVRDRGQRDPHLLAVLRLVPRNNGPLVVLAERHHPYARGSTAHVVADRAGPYETAELPEHVV